MRIAVGLAMVVIVGGCYSYEHYADGTPVPWELSHNNPDAVWRREQKAPAVIEIITDPPGANISVNGDYIGKSPCQITVTTHRYYDDRCFDNACEIVALPTSGGYVQRQEFGYGHRIVKRVFFDMRIGPVTPQIDVNVR